MFHLPLVSDPERSLTRRAKGGGLPARSPASRSLAEGRRFGEGRGGILKSLFQTTKLIRYYFGIEMDNNQMGSQDQ
ncbi:MAG: hypothetical protein A2V86_06965 [Deltaproteobacteria bacterium RBG_16_49_23]|nr:MAG: hypothetical protein A2V86_06965 [Deltaproteobacteria bacterium RBG_16_49_23]